MNIIKIIFFSLLTSFHYVYYCQIDFIENDVKNIYLLLQDSIDYNENTSQLINQVISEREDNKVLICYLENEKLKQILISASHLDTITKIFPTWSKISYYNKDIIFDFILTFDKYFNDKLNSNININLLLSSNNFSKFLSNNSNIILNQLWNSICLISGVDKNKLVKKVYLIDSNNSINDDLSIKKLESQFLSQIIITTL